MPNLPSKVTNDLMALYSEGHRHYHNVNHLMDCFLALDRYLKLVDPGTWDEKSIKLVEAMIWFHDAVYDVGPDVPHGQNEARSVELFKASEAFQLFKPDQRDIIMSGIEASAHHLEYYRYFNPAVTLFLDIDLCGMGQDYETFLRNDHNISKEYAWAGPKKVLQGRRQFFEKLLERPFLYGNKIMRGMYEESTRNNINLWLGENS